MSKSEIMRQVARERNIPIQELTMADQKLLKYRASVQRATPQGTDPKTVEIEGVISDDTELGTVRDHFIQKANATGEWTPMPSICFDYRVHLHVYGEL